MSYGADRSGMYVRAAAYVDKILRGAKPADLPVEQPSEFELAITLNTASKPGVAIPPDDPAASHPRDPVACWFATCSKEDS